MTAQRTFHWISLGALASLIALSLAWELWLAPLRPGGSWLALKALPLLFPLKGMLAGNTYTHRWAMMLALAYVTEGIVRLYSEAPPSSTLALLEIVLATTFFASSIAFVRAARSPKAVD